MIDNEKEAYELIEALNEHLPMRAYATLPLVKAVRRQGADIQVNDAVKIDSVLYLGDEGGVACSIGLPGGKTVVVTSITHLRIDSDHPLARRIQAYQLRRSQHLEGPKSRSSRRSRASLALPPNIVDMYELSDRAIRTVFALAERLSATPPRVALNTCRGRIVATLFYQPSTRTRLNFESAAQRLGASVVGFSDPATTRAGDYYRETLEDVIRFTSELVDLIVVRHHETGAAARAGRVSSVPVISAGDGYGQHPTQALGDIWTMTRCLGDLRQARIGMLGDVHIRSLKAISIGLGTLEPV